ncbi:MAG: hypothetical protein KDJ16_06710 [Hyphomicrobiales bacterium]|nr:hypothetical protein [Hyphomicrobiales bacterium]
MTKIIAIFFALIACVQLIRPIGIFGLNRRSDAWKVAAIGFLVIVAAMVLSVSLKSAV